MNVRRTRGEGRTEESAIVRAALRERAGEVPFLVIPFCFTLWTVGVAKNHWASDRSANVDDGAMNADQVQERADNLCERYRTRHQSRMTGSKAIDRSSQRVAVGATDLNTDGDVIQV